MPQVKANNSKAIKAATCRCGSDRLVMTASRMVSGGDGLLRVECEHCGANGPGAVQWDLALSAWDNLMSGRACLFSSAGGER